MARTKGTFTVAGNFEVKAGKLLDARCFVADKTALKAQDTWVVDGINYLSEGLTVYVKSEKAVYTYTGDTPDGYASDANWKKLSDQKPTVDNTVSDSTNPISSNGVQNEFISLFFSQPLPIGTDVNSFEGKYYAVHTDIFQENSTQIGTKIVKLGIYKTDQIEEIISRLGLGLPEIKRGVDIPVNLGIYTDATVPNSNLHIKEATINLTQFQATGIPAEEQEIVTELCGEDVGNSTITKAVIRTEYGDAYKEFVIVGTGDGGTQQMKMTTVKKGIFIQ